MVEIVQIWIDGQVLAREHLGELGSGEAGHAGIALEQGNDRVVERGNVRIGDNAFATVLVQIEQNLVLGEVSMIYNDLNTVL